MSTLVYKLIDNTGQIEEQKYRWIEQKLHGEWRSGAIALSNPWEHT